MSAPGCKDIESAVYDALEECDIGEVLSTVTAVFVGLYVEFARRNGAKEGAKIEIDGGEQRDITIHEEKRHATRAN